MSNDSSLSRADDDSIQLEKLSPISNKQQHKSPLSSTNIAKNISNFDDMARVHSCEYKHSSALGLVKADELKMPKHERVNSGLDSLSQISQIIKVEKLSESSFSEPEELSQEDEKHLPLDIKKNHLKPR